MSADPYHSPMAALLAFVAERVVEEIVHRIGAPVQDGALGDHDAAVHALRVEVLELLARHLVRAASLPLTGFPYQPNAEN